MIQQQDQASEDWKLKSISITFQDWGDYKGKYLGKIAFENRVQEAFMFNIRPELCEDYLKLISKELVGAAGMLSEKLMHSLKLLPTSELIQIDDKHTAMIEDMQDEIVELKERIISLEDKVLTSGNILISAIEHLMEIPGTNQELLEELRQRVEL